MKFTTHLSLVQGLRINGDIPPPPSLYDFVVWRAKTVPLPLYKNEPVKSGVFNMFWQLATNIVWCWFVGHLCKNHKHIYTYCINYCVIFIVCVCVCV